MSNNKTLRSALAFLGLIAFVLFLFAEPSARTLPVNAEVEAPAPQGVYQPITAATVETTYQFHLAQPANPNNDSVRWDACRTWSLWGHEDGRDALEALACAIETLIATLTPDAGVPPTTFTATPPATPTDHPTQPPVTTTVEPPSTEPPATEPPANPTKEKKNCGVGQDEPDGDTPGCPNGRNDGPGTEPGNPGSKGGNGNNPNPKPEGTPKPGKTPKP